MRFINFGETALNAHLTAETVLNAQETVLNAHITAETVLNAHETVLNAHETVLNAHVTVLNAHVKNLPGKIHLVDMYKITWYVRMNIPEMQYLVSTR